MADDRGRDVRRARSVQTEFQQHRDDDLRMVGGSEADEPAMIGAAGILRGSGLAGERETLNRGGSRGAARFEHRLETFQHHRVLQLAQAEYLLPLRHQVSDLRSRRLTAGSERAIELRHVDDRLRVRALPDRQVQRLGVAPSARAVLLVVVVDRVGPAGLVLFRQIDPGLVAHGEADPSGDELREPDLQAELIEVHVARMLDRALEVERAVALLLPAAEVAVAELVATGARHGHVLIHPDDAVLAAR